MEFERRIRWYQRAFHEYLVNTPGARAIEIAHRRWGKDEIALGATCELAHKRIGSYWHCLPEYAQGRKALWTAVNAHTGKKRIDEAFPPELRKRTNDQEMFIEMQCGSTWQIIGSDRYDATVGAGVAGIVYSEWALANPSAWAYHRPMLEENNGWAAFITTPRGRNHAYSMFNMARNNPRWFAEVSSIHDTGALSPEQIEDSLNEYVALYGEDLGRAQFEQEYLCSFNAAILGAFYAREMLAVRNDGRIRPVVAVPGQPVHTAWDIGVRDDTSIWWFQVYGGRVYILDCYTASGAGVDHYAEICHSKPYQRGVDYVPHDAKVKEWGTGKTRVETMRQHGLNPQLISMATKLDGVNAVRKLLPLCVFDPKCEDVGISALEQYRREWDDDKKCFKATEVHDWTSHLADAFRYLAMAWKHAPKVEVTEKPAPPPGSVMLPGAPKPQLKTRISV
jgi:hypothetical protein